MNIIKEFWRGIAAFRAKWQGGEAMAASRKHEDELQRELRDERESRRIAKRWVKAKTPVELEAAIDEIKRYVLDDPESGAGPLRSAKDNELTDELEWSSNPGAHESHLAKRHNNPYFPPPRRIISKEALAEAKRMDNDELMLAKQRLELCQTKIEALPAIATVSDLLRLREDLDDLIHFSMGVGGLAKEIASKADQLRDGVILTMREAFSDDAETLEAIEEANFYHRDHMTKFNVPVMAQTLRENSPIVPEEMLASVLSEDPITISIVLDLTPEDAQASMRVAALMLMRQALDEGYRDPQFEEKLAVLSD